MKKILFLGANLLSVSNFKDNMLEYIKPKSKKRNGEDRIRRIVEVYRKTQLQRVLYRSLPQQASSGLVSNSVYFLMSAYFKIQKGAILQKLSKFTHETEICK